MVEITQLSTQHLGSGPEGACIDTPRLGDRLPSHIVEVGGRLIGASRRAVAVELINGDAVIGRTTTDVDGRFKAQAAVAGMVPLSFRMDAVLPCQTRVAIASVRAERIWEEQHSAVGAPLVSVVIPCFDSSRFVGDAIESVLVQTYPRFEIIVVDDGSHDNAAAIVDHYPGVRYVRQTNQGLACARNAGLRLANGSFVVFLDADDRLRPNALHIGLSELAADPAAGFVSGRCVHIGFDGSRLPTTPAPIVETDHYRELLRNCYIWTSGAIMYRRILFTCLGEFDTSFQSSSDHEFFLRAARNSRVRCHGQVVAEYRRHGRNMTRDAADNLRERIDLLRMQRRLFGRDASRYIEAHREGLKFAREYYGDPLVTAVVSDVATGEWRRALRGYRTLLTHYPLGAASALMWLIRQTFMRVRVERHDR